MERCKKSKQNRRHIKMKEMEVGDLLYPEWKLNYNFLKNLRVIEAETRRNSVGKKARELSRENSLISREITQWFWKRFSLKLGKFTWEAIREVQVIFPIKFH